MATTTGKNTAAGTTRPKTARVMSRVSKSQAPHPVKWTKDRYYRMGKLGWFDGKRVELIEGELIEMAPMNSPHAAAIMLTSKALEETFGADYIVREQLPFNAGIDSEPEPDIAVVTGNIRDYVEHHPTTALLIVEISDATLQFDRTKKAELYARSGIVEYWIVNLKARTLEVRREPQDGKYAKTETLTEKQSIAPLATPKKKIKVADLLP